MSLKIWSPGHYMSGGLTNCSHLHRGISLRRFRKRARVKNVNVPFCPRTRFSERGRIPRGSDRVKNRPLECLTLDSCGATTFLFKKGSASARVFVRTGQPGAGECVYLRYSLTNHIPVFRGLSLPDLLPVPYS